MRTTVGSEEIELRIAQAKATFMKMKKVIFGNDLHLELKIRLICYVQSVLFYDAEACTLKKLDTRTVE